MMGRDGKSLLRVEWRAMTCSKQIDPTETKGNRFRCKMSYAYIENQVPDYGIQVEGIWMTLKGRK